MRVLVAMSGGVDSSVAAFLLQQQGYDVAGVTMRLTETGRENEGVRCFSAEAIRDARQVCEKLRIPHYVFDYGEELEKKVIAPFIVAYRQGRTPNPCINCNRYLKFGSLHERARALGFDLLATGHYAAITEGTDGHRLAKPRDRRKDQTYFLYHVPREVLSSVLFPLAPFTKEEVRAIALKKGLPVTEKGESQDVCFVTQKNYRDFLSERIGEVRPGPIVDMSGKILGEHKGIVFYTIGQRGGLGISAKAPLYVVAIDVVGNRLIVGGEGGYFREGTYGE